MFVANAVRALHIGIVGAYCCAPFAGPTAVAIHLAAGPWLGAHWAMNDDTCCLTLLEMKLRGAKSCKDSFVFSVVSPLYKPKWHGPTHKKVVWAAATALWMVSVCRAARTIRK